VYLLHGLTGHFDNWTDKTELAKFSEKFDFIIVTPEGGDGWYSDSATVPNDKYESYIVKELIPEIDARYPTMPNREGRFIAGLSMGGYGALKFGLKYPERFAAAGSFSGALRATDWTDKMIGEWLAKSIMSVFGSAESENRKVNDIFRRAREWPAEKITELPFLYVDCGTEDFLIENSHDFAKILREKKIPHEFRELPGKHDWVYWNSQVREFLMLADRMSAKPTAKTAISTN
jgi:S-formylglutathione hydrolase FrmB